MDTENRSAGSVRLGAGVDLSALKDVPMAALVQAVQSRLGATEATQILGRMLGQLRTQLAFATECGANRYSRTMSQQLLAMARWHPQFRDELVAGATVVEFGCGALNPLSGHLAFAALGAARCIGLDLEQPEAPNLAARAMYEVAAEMALAPELYFAPASPDPAFLRANLQGIDFARLRAGDMDGLPADRFQVLSVSAEATGLAAASADLCISASFLEHVTDVDAVVAELARVSKPDRIGVHLIDGADHRSYWKREYDDLEFLTEEPGGGHYTGCNRMRPLQFVERFEAHGFEVLDFRPMRRQEITPEFRARLVAPYAAMSDAELSVVDAHVFVRRR